MSNSNVTMERLVELVEQTGVNLTEVKRAIVEDNDNADLVELVEDLWEVLEEATDVLETIDFEELPEAIEFDELEENVDTEDIPERLLNDDESAIELRDLQEAVNLRELWDAVDLTELREEKQELDSEVEDVEEDLKGEEGEEDDDGLLDDDDGNGLISNDDDEDGMFENVISTEGANVQFNAEARQAFLEDKIQTAIEKFRSVLFSTHEKLYKLYELNQEKLGQPDSRNPTAYSSLPPGPIPDSASTRHSTVPAQVKYSKAENPRRIYGRRFTKATKRASTEENETKETDT